MSTSTPSNGPGTTTAAAAPDCFGDAERVCPKDGGGFFQPRAECVGCDWVRRCLQAALEKAGLMRVAPESAAAECGMMRFLKRWSAKKRSAESGVAD